jgi:peptidoglycan/LPS O-acetylase OafA/YrhL
MAFRKDINGLRAIAVIAVVLFHFNPIWLSGGFAGVDVFFVISGFLMTGIICRGLENNDFSILRFYVARANRIIPALAVLCSVLLIFGWFYLTPLDFRQLGKHAAGSVGFISNFLYWLESGYFEASSLEKWLLHTWSLSVEWQFYLIYPLFILGVRKVCSVEAIKPAVLALTVIGFILCMFITYNWPSAGYYLLPARVWEMAIGGVAYLYPLQACNRQKKLLESVGIIFIVGSYVFASSNTLWPGYYALFPVLGSLFVILAQRENSIITGNYVFQKVGLWSYSIYLWHWPLVVAIYYFSLDAHFVYLGILLSFMLGFVSYTSVERVRFSNYSSFLELCKCKPVYLSLLIGGLGGYIFLLKGIESRFNLPSRLADIKSELVMPLRGNGYCFYSFDGFSDTKVSKDIGVGCYLGAKGGISNTLLFGDSYAGHNEPFFDEIFKSKGLSFNSIVTNWCVPSLTDRFTGPLGNLAYKQCLLNREYLKDNISRYKNIILAGAWHAALSKDQLKDVGMLVEYTAAKGVNVFIMAAPYTYQNNPLQYFYRSIYFERNFNIADIPGKDELTAQANRYLKNLSKNYPNVHFIGRELLYRDDNTFEKDGFVIPYSLDGEHISILGSKNSAKYFMQHPAYDEFMSKFDFN